MKTLNIKLKTTGFNCDKCFDTGCECGGIGLSCEGCCDCRTTNKKVTSEKIKIFKDLRKFSQTDIHFEKEEKKDGCY